MSLIRAACDARTVASGAMDRCLGKPYRTGVATSWGAATQDVRPCARRSQAGRPDSSRQYIKLSYIVTVSAATCLVNIVLVSWYSEGSSCVELSPYERTVSQDGEGERSYIECDWMLW